MLHRTQPATPSDVFQRPFMYVLSCLHICSTILFEISHFLRYCMISQPNMTEYRTTLRHSIHVRGHILIFQIFPTPTNLIQTFITFCRLKWQRPMSIMSEGSFLFFMFEKMQCLCIIRESRGQACASGVVKSSCRNHVVQNLRA